MGGERPGLDKHAVEDDDVLRRGEADAVCRGCGTGGVGGTVVTTLTWTSEPAGG